MCATTTGEIFFKKSINVQLYTKYLGVKQHKLIYERALLTTQQTLQALGQRLPIATGVSHSIILADLHVSMVQPSQF